ncbi:hypothetical protein CesoFtcFv8_027873 [Champsocephalus esox]|uniref:Uncharacterized protein n=2 Tax=Champsocephalus TaxID=52236 RepID=A0AAN8BU96_CHAGU|nr:hypothetical protein CesoFtcFv8_027873 [Champsocephalus esox]KAK5891610.1 hypothetical protein CgunFtcFv8_018841 [Champsocephalus gunnari]
MTPRCRRRLTPSPTLTYTHPPPTTTTPSSLPPALQKNLSGWDPHLQTPSTLRCCHRPWGYPAKNSGPPKKQHSFSLSLCLVPLFSTTPFCAGQMTQCADSHGAGLSHTVGKPLWPPQWRARSVGLIASEVNKIGDKNQFQKRPGTQEAALR